MKRLLSILVILFVAAFAFSSQAHAKGIPIFFGEQEDIHKIMDVELKGGENENLFLGYKTNSYYLLAGVYIKDDGYVLGVKGERGSYYPFPSGDELNNFQTFGMLPKALPEYSIPFFDYVIGYSLWIILFFIVVYFVGKNAVTKSRPVE